MCFPSLYASSSPSSSQKKVMYVQCSTGRVEKFMEVTLLLLPSVFCNRFWELPLPTSLSELCIKKRARANFLFPVLCVQAKKSSALKKQYSSGGASWHSNLSGARGGGPNPTLVIPRARVSRGPYGGGFSDDEFMSPVEVSKKDPSIRTLSVVHALVLP